MEELELKDVQSSSGSGSDSDSGSGSGSGSGKLPIVIVVLVQSGSWKYRGSEGIYLLVCLLLSTCFLGRGSQGAEPGGPSPIVCLMMMMRNRGGGVFADILGVWHGVLLYLRCCVQTIHYTVQPS